MGYRVRELTQKQRKFLRAYLETGAVPESAVKAGYSRKTALAMGRRLLETESMKVALQGEQERLRAIRGSGFTDSQMKTCADFASREQILGHFERIRAEAQEQGDHNN